ncbi:MAG: MaoC family dehydratase [Pseudomonadota bacterium]
MTDTPGATSIETGNGKAVPTKTNPGRFFEDFKIGETLTHATPRTLTAGDVAVYNALYGSRFAVQSADSFAQAIGLPRSPIDDLLVFHTVFGKTVPDISLNAVANLGYAACQFNTAVYPGDTLSASTKTIGLKENSNGKTGVVYVETTGVNQRDEVVLSFNRWVMVNKRDQATPTGAATVPDLPSAVAPERLGQHLRDLDISAYDDVRAGAPHRFDAYKVSETIAHVDGVTVEEAEHQSATRLYQNTAKVHFDQVAANAGRHGRRLIYGGVVISLARALSFNGLANAFAVLAINGGRHVAPLFAGDTVYAFSTILEKADIAAPGLGGLRVRTLALKNENPDTFPMPSTDGKYHEATILDLDYWVALPK